MTKRKAPRTAFKKGDPRAVEAGRKSKRPADRHIFEELRRIGPDAIKAVEARLKEDDMTAARLVLDRIAPADLLKDIEAQELVSALNASNEELTAEVERLRTDNARLRSELDFINEAIPNDARNAGKRASRSSQNAGDTTGQ